jgi:LPXTG-site transpeptidase (sortase) family protein
MNQILVTEKLYITPEIKKKKRMYKVRFFLSVFLICILCSYYIYAESDRNKSEEVSHQIAADYSNANKEKENDTTTAKFINDVMIVALDERQSENAQNDIVEDLPQETSMTEYVAKDGEDYTAEAFLTITKLDISYPVLSKTSDELLKISLNKYWGNGPNKVGNYCIVGHNYANGKLFGKLSQMEIGDIAELKSISNGKTVQYEAYAKYTVNPDDVSCTSQLTDGKREITLITCKNFGTQRLIIKCREI